MLKTAARVGSAFQFDPVIMLTDPDPFHWMVRVAAYNVVGADRKASQSGVTGSTPSAPRSRGRRR